MIVKVSDILEIMAPSSRIRIYDYGARIGGDPTYSGRVLGIPDDLEDREVFQLMASTSDPGTMFIELD